MFRTMSRKLAAATILVVVGLAPSLVTPAHASTAPPSNKTTVVTAGSVSEARQAVSNTLAANDASRAWPTVDADLTPKLESTIAAGGGTVRSEVISLPFKIIIKCEITFPPLKIKCTIEIIVNL